MAELKAKLEIGKARLDRAVAKGAKVTEKITIAVKEREAAVMAKAEALKERLAMQKFKEGLGEDFYRSRKVVARLANKVKEMQIRSHQA